jgi:stage V sporulation protein AC
MDKNTKLSLIQKHSPKSPVLKNCIWAFLGGGAICSLGEGARLLLLYFGVSEKDAPMLVTLIFIFLGSLLTALGVFDLLARRLGAGTLVPVTGFSNSITAEAVEARYEGYILGVGAKIFTVAGPVIAYSLFSGAIYGVILYFINMFLG